MTQRLIIVHSFDPWGKKIGGIESVIRTMIKAAPDCFRLGIVGTTEDQATRPVRQWTRHDYLGVAVDVFPLFAVADPNRRNAIPLNLRFMYHFRRFDLPDGESHLLYHRIEPPAVARCRAKSRTLIVHYDPGRQLSAQSEVKWKYIPWLYRWAERTAIGKVDRLYVVNRNGLEYYKSQYPTLRESISFLPTWYRDDVFYPVSPRETQAIKADLARRFQFRADRRIVLFAGRWQHQKNPIKAIRSFAYVIDQIPDIHLIMLGEGSLEHEIRQTIEKLRLSDWVTLIPPQPPETIADLMRASDVFLMTSEFEGMPITVLESLACGLPVVSTATGETKALLHSGQTGVISRDDSIESIGAALRQVLTRSSLFDKYQCSRSVDAYRPEMVLAPFFERMERENDG